MRERSTAPSKRALRRAVRAARDALAPETRRERSQAACAQASQLTRYAQANTIGIYSPIGSELDVSPLATDAFSRGKRVALPRVASGSVMHFVPHALGEPLVRSRFGTLEPSPDSPAVPTSQLDLIVVPGTAFDLRGHRLGYGAGFYDRVLADAPGVCRLGIAFEVQIVAAVPHGAHDLPMDLLVTELRVLPISQGG
ncbi:MAG: 5-formyltetrahydrofolate cyclo-ligase [Myxococcales bacterium]|nr:5-formyltetrahydrofolate cyclo-ligase [Myxococcales bacterium]MDD9964707.1 5-formyltetrahydrofolate cyclo-ligase [Myxococcales bacterium]